MLYPLVQANDTCVGVELDTRKSLGGAPAYTVGDVVGARSVMSCECATLDADALLTTAAMTAASNVVNRI
jgi:hypothetical protein